MDLLSQINLSIEAAASALELAKPKGRPGAHRDRDDHPEELRVYVQSRGQVPSGRSVFTGADGGHYYLKSPSEAGGRASAGQAGKHNAERRPPPRSLSPNRSVQTIVAAAYEQGWGAEKTGTNHIRMYPPDPGERPWGIPCTPSDVRSLKNAIAPMKRAGFVMPSGV